MNFKLKLGLVSLSYLGQFNSKSNIQDEFWNLENKSFHLAPTVMGLLMEKSPAKDSTTKNDLGRLHNKAPAQIISLALASPRKRTQVNYNSGSRAMEVQEGQPSEKFLQIW